MKQQDSNSEITYESQQYESRRMKDLVRSYISRLENNNLDINTILVHKSHMYEINAYTKKIRPFNSIIWYDLDSLGMFDDVIAFISKDYDEFKNSGEVQGELSKYKYGYIDNNTIVYELEKIKQKSEGYKNGKNLKIAKQCNKLGDAIDDLYSGWNKMYSFLINNYDKKEVSKLFGMGE